MVSFSRYDDYVPNHTLLEARARYFEDNGFGADGGYDSAWVDFMLGPVPFPFPNTAARVRAVRYHDLHHVLTGYATDFWGEMDISAWELGAGCRNFAAAWQLNLGGLAVGALWKPIRTFSAFVRGRRSRSLYGLPFDELLQQTVGEVREHLGLSRLDPRGQPKDVALFVASALLGLGVGLATFVMIVPLLPIAYVAFSRKRRTVPAA